MSEKKFSLLKKVPTLLVLSAVSTPAMAGKVRDYRGCESINPSGFQVVLEEDELYQTGYQGFYGTVMDGENTHSSAWIRGTIKDGQFELKVAYTASPFPANADAEVGVLRGTYDEKKEDWDLSFEKWDRDEKKFSGEEVALESCKTQKLSYRHDFEF